MGHHIVEFDYECTNCKGTGIYVGFAEQDGAGVVCHTCRGTGKAHRKFEYDDFEGRKARPNIKRVYEANPGVCIGGGPDSVIALEDFGGMDYQEWLDGKPFPPKSECREYICPAWWYQTVNYGLKPNWCREYGSSICGVFSECPRFPQKELCWARFDKEHSRENV